MKKHTSARLIFLLLSLLIAFTAGAQNTPTTLSGWAERLKKFGTSVPQEEIFVHMDNASYFLGDTIYYKAYLRRSDTGNPSGLSGLLYVELLNQDGYLVQRQKIKMTEGQGHGSFVLLDTLYGGYYELRAYTRWQLNWGQTEHPHTKAAEKWFYSKKMAKQYYRDYEKLYSRVFPVYDKPQEAGEYYQEMTVRPLRRYFKADNNKPKALLSFYPEGGNLVAGTTCRVAYEVNDEEGKHLKGTLEIKNNAGEVVALSTIENRGRGTFDLPCVAGEKYKAVFSGEEQSVTRELPKLAEEGVCLHATLTEKGIHVELQNQGPAAQEALGITAMSHGVVCDYQDLGTHASTSTDITLDKLPTGVVQLTVFNASGRVYADRLVFVRQPNFKAQNITFSGISKNGYEAFAPIQFQLQGLPSSTVSLAVRDAAHSDYTFDSGNILTEMLLASQIKGFVEQPEYFFESDDEEHTRALDLLLMVQGWRRYDWVTMATPGAFTLTNTYETSEILMGEVNVYTADAQEDPFAAMIDAEAEAFMNSEGGVDTENLLQEGVSSDIGNAKGFENMQKELKDANRNDRLGTRDYGDHNVSAERFHENEGTIKHEAVVHAEFLQAFDDNTTDGAQGEVQTYNKGSFKIEAPRFFDKVVMNLSAIDSAKWAKNPNYNWIQNSEDNNYRLIYPDYYVKLNPIFPRFVKPYSYYQENHFDVKRPQEKRRLSVDEANVTTLNEVTIGAKRNGMRGFNPSKPAFVIDAYEAFNETCDAGLCPGYFIGGQRFTWDLTRTYIGDMNMERAYDIERRFNGKNLSANLSDGEKNYYDHLPNLDKVYIYTDYSPRREGDKRYSQDNQPVVTIDLHKYEDNGKRYTYRDRHYILTGYAICEDFYQPNYSKKPLPSKQDYRRTLYWNPDLKLDAQGQAQITLYNNNSKSEIIVSAEGLTSQGAPQTGISYPEDR